MKTYLAVPYGEKDEAKTLGAKWDPVEKKWYAPNGEAALIQRWTLNIEPLKELVGEDRSFSGNNLFVDLIPRTCWFTNVRTSVHSSDWDRLRNFIYTRANNQCECCHAGSPLEAHERWHYDEKNRVQKLVRLVALCRSCHEATHMGLAQIKGRDEIATQHLMKVTGMDRRTADRHIEKAFKLWAERNWINWTLDLSIITNSGIKLARQVRQEDRGRIAAIELDKVRKKEFAQELTCSTTSGASSLAKAEVIGNIGFLTKRRQPEPEKDIATENKEKNEPPTKRPCRS